MVSSTYFFQRFNLMVPRCRSFLIKYNQYRYMATQVNFEDAVDRLKNGKSVDVDNATKLRIYGLYKQCSDGSAPPDGRPGPLNFIARAKYDAWMSNANMSVEEARQAYIDAVNDIVGAPAGNEQRDSDTATSKTVSTEAMYTSTILTSTSSDGVHTITLNRPKQLNAFSWQMYTDVMSALDAAEKDDAVTTVVVTGSGSYYSSGNDLTNFSDHDDLSKMAAAAADVCRKYVNTWLRFSKPLIAAVNGPSLGIATTTSALADIVYASDGASFRTPFTALGQTPEGVSSLIFPQRMGMSKASEMLLMGRQLSANDALQAGLVAQVFPEDIFMKEVMKRAQVMARLPPESVQLIKKLMKESLIEKMHEVNQREVDILQQRWVSDECTNAIKAFVASKK